MPKPHHLPTAQEPQISARLLNTSEVAVYLGLSATTLKMWRTNRTPDTPPWVKVGHAIRYDLRTLDAWIDGLSRSAQDAS